MVLDTISKSPPDDWAETNPAAANAKSVAVLIMAFLKRPPETFVFGSPSLK